MPDMLRDDLRRVINERNAVVLVGAGASIQASGNPRIDGHNVASWEGLLGHGLQRCLDVDANARVVPAYKDVLAGGELLGVADFVARALREKGDGGEFARWLRDTVGQFEVRNDAVLHALADLGVPLLTTNYDTLLEKATGREAFAWTDGSQWQVLQQKPNAGILHLHGIFNRPDTVVLGTGSYESVLRDAKIQNALRALASTGSLVFVGFGAGIADPNFASLRSFLSTVLADSQRRHFRLVVNGDVDTARQEHRNGERIFVLGHGDTHESLADFLLRLVPERPAAAAVPKPTERTRPVLEVDIGSVQVIATVQGERPVEGQLELDELRLETVMLLDEWLRFQEDQGDDERSKQSHIVKVLGSILFDSVFHGDVRERYRQMVQAASARAPLSIVLRVRPDFLTRFGDIDSVALTSLPWELLCDYKGRGGYLSTSSVLTFSRVYPGETDSTGWEAPIEPSVLVVLAQPERLVRPLREEWDRDHAEPYDEVVRKIVETVRHVDRRQAEESRVRIVGADQPATCDDVKEALASQLPQIIHYIGHGRARRGERSVAFADPDSVDPDWKSFTEFADSFDPEQAPILVFLHLCQGPRSLQTEEVGRLARGNFSLLAFELIKRQVRMVVAMQYPASADIGLTFTEKFYDYLIKGRTVAEAVQKARNDVKGTLPVGGPVLYLRGEDGVILRQEEPSEQEAAAGVAGPTPSESVTTTRPPSPGPSGAAAGRGQRVPAEPPFGEPSAHSPLLPEPLPEVGLPQRAAADEGGARIYVRRPEDQS